MNVASRFISVLFILFFVLQGCVESPESAKLSAAHERAQNLVQVLREKQWMDAAGFVLIDDIAMQRIGVPHGATKEDIQTGAAVWFETLYHNVLPVSVFSVEPDETDNDKVIVTYIAGDFDTFTLRFVSDEWFYSFE